MFINHVIFTTSPRPLLYVFVPKIGEDQLRTRELMLSER